MQQDPGSLHLDFLVKLFHVYPQLLVGIDQVIHGSAGMQDRGMVLIAAMQADGGERSFGVLLGKIHSQLPCLDDLPLTGLGVDGLYRPATSSNRIGYGYRDRRHARRADGRH